MAHRGDELNFALVVRGRKGARNEKARRASIAPFVGADPSRRCKRTGLMQQQCKRSNQEALNNHHHRGRRSTPLCCRCLDKRGLGWPRVATLIFHNLKICAINLRFVIVDLWLMVCVASRLIIPKGSTMVSFTFENDFVAGCGVLITRRSRPAFFPRRQFLFMS